MGVLCTPPSKSVPRHVEAVGDAPPPSDAGPCAGLAARLACVHGHARPPSLAAAARRRPRPHPVPAAAAGDSRWGRGGGGIRPSAEAAESAAATGCGGCREFCARLRATGRWRIRAEAGGVPPRAVQAVGKAAVAGSVHLPLTDSGLVAAAGCTHARTWTSSSSYEWGISCATHRSCV
jgi:hypothetical protein